MSSEKTLVSSHTFIRDVPRGEVYMYMGWMDGWVVSAMLPLHIHMLG